MYWIECKLFYFLVPIADPKLIGIKACWFVLELLLSLLDGIIFLIDIMHLANVRN